MIKIFLIHYPRALSSSISFPIDIFTGAAAAYQARHPGVDAPLIQLLDCPMPLLFKSATQLNVDRSFASLADNSRADLIILPAIWRNPKPLLRHATPLIHWLHQQHQQGAHICAVGTASCLLAETGLLDDKPATTHWFFFDEFAARYPAVKLQRKHLITQTGRLFCAGSINALADLCIYFCAQFFGAEIADKIESHFSPEIRRPVDQQLYRADAFENLSDERIAVLKYWIGEHYAEPLTTAAMAAHVKLSPRQLTRLFKQTMQTTPLKYLRKKRLEVAKSLLRDSNLKIADIAAQIGYDDDAYFIRLFKEDTQTTPGAYRIRMRAKLFN